MIPNFVFSIREDLKDTGDLFLPNRAEPGSTGYDVRVATVDRQPLTLKNGEYFKIPLGFRCVPDEGWWYHVHPRSSTLLKKHMHCLIGTIDESFPLELMLVGQYIAPGLSPMANITLNFGDPIAQIIPIKRVDMNISSVSNDEFDALLKQKSFVRTGGFGSTG